MHRTIHYRDSYDGCRAALSLHLLARRSRFRTALGAFPWGGAVFTTMEPEANARNQREAYRS